MKIAEVSLYPEPAAKHIMTSGVASYTKNLLQSIPFTKKDEVYILCDKKRGVQRAYKENKFTVLRTFDRNYKFAWQLYRQIKRLKPDIVHFQQEIALYGGVLNAYLLAWLLRVLRGKHTVVTFHQVVNQHMVTKKFVASNNSKSPVWLVKLAFRMIYKSTARYAEQIIVHESYFKDLLVDQYGVEARKIHVIPHGVEDFKAVDTRKARQKLGIKTNKHIVLFMGYLAGYKGIDLLLKGFGRYAKSDPRAYLVIGAGKHPKLHDNEKYLKEYAAKQKKAAALIPKNQYAWAGFINEDEIAEYYSAADVSLYPYTISMSSSGPMAIAMGYEKPFLGSDVFAEVLPSSVLFERSPSAVTQKLREFFDDPPTYQHIASNMKKERLWRKVGQITSAVYRESTI